MWPYVGDTARVFGDGEKLMAERLKQHGPAFTTWILGKRTTVVGSLDMMKMLLNMEHDLVEGALSPGTSKGCTLAGNAFSWLRVSMVH